MAMRVRQKKQRSVLVIWAAFGMMLLGMSVLAKELWHLQVQEKSGFDADFMRQSVRRIRLPAVRGKIFDTNGKVLADSIPTYNIAIYTEELRTPRSTLANTLGLIHEIWQRIERRPDVSYREIKEHVKLSLDKPLTVWENLTPEEQSVWLALLDQWTAPKTAGGSRRTVYGLDTEKPLQGNSIVIHTKDLEDRSTSTAANTLELIYEIADRIGIPRQVSYQDIKNHILARRPLPLMAWENITPEVMAKWADSCSSLAATDIYYKPSRTFPEGDAMAHLIGFTLEADAIREEEGEQFHFDLRDIEGRKGLESTYNELLQGEPGYQLVQIDVSGFHHGTLQTTPPKPGGDLELTIDATIQQFAMEALAMKQPGEDTSLPVRGACVILDPNNGDVLAMASSPSFDPNIYMVSPAYRRALMEDPSKRTYHRAVFGQYPPGSTFKPIAALGVLREDPTYSEVTHKCYNGFKVGKKQMRCWIHKRHGEHGEINIREALMYSCNVFMFEMALDKGYEPMRKMAEEFGIGQYAGIFPNLEEAPVQKDLKYGNLPENSLNDIDACNMAIGQGRITVSPLQMAMVAATIANGGTLYRPRLVKKWRNTPDKEFITNPTWAIRRIDIPVDALEIVRGGMYDVVQHAKGTARDARVPEIEIAGKTGSAQYTKRVGEAVVASTHTWMISYAPFHFPRYAVAMIVEDGNSGGSTIAPRLSALYKKLFEYDGTLATPEGLR